MNRLFYRCCSLTTLPDLSKWIINENNDIDEMFLECYNLAFLPDISKWNINDKHFFGECFSILNKIEK